MKSVLIAAEGASLGGYDLLDLDPEFLNAVAGGYGGDECCQAPYITTERSSDGQVVKQTVDCPPPGWRTC